MEPVNIACNPDKTFEAELGLKTSIIEWYNLVYTVQWTGHFGVYFTK